MSTFSLRCHTLYLLFFSRLTSDWKKWLRFRRKVSEQVWKLAFAILIQWVQQQHRLCSQLRFATLTSFLFSFFAVASRCHYLDLRYLTQRTLISLSPALSFIDRFSSLPFCIFPLNSDAHVSVFIQQKSIQPHSIVRLTSLEPLLAATIWGLAAS